MNAAGIGPAAKVLGRNGPHPLDLFEKTIRVNLIGTFNVIRLAAAVIAQNAPSSERRARRHRQHRLDRRVRRADRPARLRGVEGRHRRAHAARRTRVRVARHPRRHHRAGHLRHAAAGGAARSRARLARPAGAVPFAARPPAEYAALARHIIENEMLNGEVIRLDGALADGAEIDTLARCRYRKTPYEPVERIDDRDPSTGSVAERIGRKHSKAEPGSRRRSRQ